MNFQGIEFSFNRPLFSAHQTISTPAKSAPFLVSAQTSPKGAAKNPVPNLSSC
jgi:hypothetical protein